MFKIKLFKFLVDYIEIIFILIFKIFFVFIISMDKIIHKNLKDIFYSFKYSNKNILFTLY